MAARLPDPTSPHAVEDGMFRVLAWLRLVVTANMVGFAAFRRDTFDHPAAGMAVVAALVLWTVVVIWLYSDHRRRSWVLLAADLAIAVGALLVTPWLKGDDFGATVPGFWVMAAVLVWSARWGARGGFVAALAVAAADLGIRWPDISESNYGNVFLLLIGGPLLGRLGSALKDLAHQRDAAQRAAALAEERARLARAVHDGVLQVLALVQRRGADLGPDGAELARLAGEQESRLRTMIQTAPSRLASEHSEVDLAALLGELALRPTPAVALSVPGAEVLLPARIAHDLVAAAAACLDNVARHVGDDATAWVFLEELPDRVVVSVRDDGAGIMPGRLDAAASEGRLGVSESIIGRITDLGGSVDLHSDDRGTEWELSMPKVTP